MISQRRIGQLYRFSVYVKGFDALLEGIAGFGLAWLKANEIQSWIKWLIQYETARHPSDLVVAGLESLARSAAMPAEKFFGFYLLAHGLVKITFVIGLLRRKLWAYPFALAAMALFIAYEIYRLSYGYDIALLLFMLFDVLFTVLVAYEFWRRSHSMPLRRIG